MELRGLSATGIRDFLQCVLKVVFRYDREISSVKNDHAKVGIAVHEALEQFTRRMLNKKSFPDASDYEFTTNIFMNAATREGMETMAFYSQGKEMVVNFIDKYDPSEDVLAVEHFFKLKTPEGIPIVGAMDKVVRINDDTIAVIDYKTARTALTNWELQDDIQLSMYDLAASLIWPEYKNRLLFLDYVRIDKRVSTFRTDEDRATFREFLGSIWIQMNKIDEQEVRGRINRLCGWCDYKTYCDAYGELMAKPLPVLPQLAEMTDSEFLDHWTNVSEKKSVLTARERELKMIASERSMKDEPITDGSRMMYSTQAARTNYDIEEVVEIMPQDDLFTVLAVNKARLDRYAKDRPDLKNALGRIAKVNYNAPVFKVKNLPKEEIDEQSAVDKDENAA